MQSNCPKCGGGAFRVTPSGPTAPARVECLTCGHKMNVAADFVEGGARPETGVPTARTENRVWSDQLRYRQLQDLRPGNDLLENLPNAHLHPKAALDL
jgi:hypothetical protein